MRYGDRERKDGLRRAVVRKRKKKKTKKNFRLISHKSAMPFVFL